MKKKKSVGNRDLQKTKVAPIKNTYIMKSNKVLNDKL